MKVILPAALFAVCAMATGCSGVSKEAESSEKSLKEKIEACSNADSISVYMEQAKCYADSLARAGKAEEARRYLDELTPVVEKQAPSLKDQWASAVAGVGDATRSAADSVAGKADALADSVASKSVDMAGKVGDKAEDVYNKAKDGVKEGVNDVKDAAGSVVDKLKGK
ncbi:MAG: hypothetical protein K2L77_09455 [Muribaculaceae bacterium]|nr:hypothetical protein [Muribaculaceae bacterium]